MKVANIDEPRKQFPRRELCGGGFAASFPGINRKEYLLHECGNPMMKADIHMRRMNMRVMALAEESIALETANAPRDMSDD